MLPKVSCSWPGTPQYFKSRMSLSTSNNDARRKLVLDRHLGQDQTKKKTRWKVLRESTTPRESEIWGFCLQHLATHATPTIRSIKCKQSPVYGFFDRYFHIPLPIVTKHELGLLFPPSNLPIKLGTNPSTIFLVIVVTDRQTHKPTPVKTYSFTFAGRMILLWSKAASRVLAKCFLLSFKFSWNSWTREELIEFQKVKVTARG